MNKLTEGEHWVLEKGLEIMQSKMVEIETKLGQIEDGEIEAIKEGLEAEYKRLQRSADLNAHILRNSFTTSKWEDMPVFDYHLTEMR
jgi:hypothetical protein